MKLLSLPKTLPKTGENSSIASNGPVSEPASMNE